MSDLNGSVLGKKSVMLGQEQKERVSMPIESWMTEKKNCIENMEDNLQFIQKSKELAKTHEWLYHCTKTDALKNILKNREFWLSNLKTVNDEEEAGRIDIPEYENKYYVCCFTYDPQIPDEHWEEYGSESDGVLVGVKKEWFLRKAAFMCGYNTKCEDEFLTIWSECDKALAFLKSEQQKRHIINPFYINSFDFFQVVYEDELERNIAEDAWLDCDGTKMPGRILTPEVAGIIKSTHGICRRYGKDSYEKAWRTEKEVRLKVGVQQIKIFSNGNEYHDGTIMKNSFFPKIAVPVSDKAFDTLKIAFSPKFDNRDNFLKELREILPKSCIEVI